MATKRAKTKRKAAVAKTKNNGKGNVPAIVTTDLFSQDAGIGVQDLTTEDLAIPFLKVLQKMSPELDDLDVRAGDIFNTVTKEGVSGKDGVRVVPCAYRLEYIEWEPRGTGSGAPVNIYVGGADVPETQRGEDNKDYIVDGNGRHDTTGVAFDEGHSIQEVQAVEQRPEEFEDEGQQWKVVYTCEVLSHLVDEKSARGEQKRFVARLGDIQGLSDRRSESLRRG